MRSWGGKIGETITLDTLTGKSLLKLLQCGRHNEKQRL